MSDEDSEDSINYESAEVTVEVEDGEEFVLGEVTDISVEDTHREFEVADDGVYEGSFEVRDDGGLFESVIAETAFESGMEKALADELDDIISADEDVGGVPPPETFLGERSSPDVIEELTVDSEQAEKLFRIVYQKLNQYQTEMGQLPDRLVLGVPQFKTMEAYTRDLKGESVEQTLPVDKVIVVPGPQIHCVRDPYSMVEASLEDAGDS